jgi:chromosome segregation ATPase
VEGKHQREIAALEKVVGQQKGKIEMLESSLKKMRELQASQVQPSLMEEVKAARLVYDVEVGRLTAEAEAKDRQIGELQGRIEGLKEEVAKLQIPVGALERANQANKALSEELARQEAECAAAVSVIKDKEAELADQGTTIHKLRLKISELKCRTVQTVPLGESELGTLRAEVDSKDKIIANLERLFEAQSEDVRQALRQEVQFQGLCTRFDDLVRGIDLYIDNLQKEQAALVETHKEALDTIAVKREEDATAFYQILDDFQARIPSTLAERWPSQRSGSFATILDEALRVLLGEIERLDGEIADSPIAARLETLSRDYEVMLSHLTSAHTFMGKVAGTAQILRDGKRNQLLAECARIGQYIADREFEVAPSPLFDVEGMSTIDGVSHVFLGLVSDEQLEESPFRELIALFFWVCQLNAILVDKMEREKACLSQIEDLTEANHSQQETIESLTAWKSKQSEINEELAPVLRKLVSDPPAEFEELSRQFIDDVSQRQVPGISEDVLQYVDALAQHVDELEQCIEGEEKKRAEKETAHCKEVEGRAAAIEASLLSQQRKGQKMEGRLKAQIKELESTLSQERESHSQFREETDKTIAICDRKMSRGNDELIALQEKFDDLQRSFSEQNAELALLTEKLETAQSELTKTSDALEREFSQAKQYRQLLEESEARNTKILHEVKARNDELSAKYSPYLDNLVSENTKLKSDLAAKVEEIEAARETAKQIANNNRELQAKQRTLEFRQQELENALQRERESSLSKQRAVAGSVKSQCDSEIDRLTRTIERCRAVLAKVLKAEFSVSKIDSSIDGILAQTNVAIEQRATEQTHIADYYRLRRLFDFDGDASLVDEFSGREERIRDLEATVHRLMGDRKELQTTVQNQKRQIDKLLNLRTENQQWVNWSRTLLGQLSGPRSTTWAATDVQFLLQEACLSSIGNRSLSFKLSSLREQKRILLSPKFSQRAVLAHSRPKEKLASVRPMIVTLLVLRKMEKMSGHSRLGLS